MADESNRIQALLVLYLHDRTATEYVSIYVPDRVLKDLEERQPAMKAKRVSRRRFMQTAAAASLGPLIVPRHVLGGAGYVAPSDTFGGALIGCGGRGNGTFQAMSQGLTVRKLAECDVRFLGRADNKTIYTDFRRVLDRRDIDLVGI